MEELLIRYPSLSQVDLTIRKPWAPVGLPLESVGVSISRNAIWLSSPWDPTWETAGGTWMEQYGRCGKGETAGCCRCRITW